MGSGLQAEGGGIRACLQIEVGGVLGVLEDDDAGGLFHLLVQDAPDDEAAVIVEGEGQSLVLLLLYLVRGVLEVVCLEIHGFTLFLLRYKNTDGFRMDLWAWMGRRRSAGRSSSFATLPAWPV